MSPELELIKNISVIVAVIIVVIIGMGKSLKNIIEADKIKDICTYDVKATIVDFKEIKDDNDIQYKPIIEYEYKDNKYTLELKNTIYSDKSELNKEIEIQINPDEPTVVYEKGMLSFSPLIITIIIVAALIFIFDPTKHIINYLIK